MNQVCCAMDRVLFSAAGHVVSHLPLPKGESTCATPSTKAYINTYKNLNNKRETKRQTNGDAVNCRWLLKSKKKLINHSDSTVIAFSAIDHALRRSVVLICRAMHADPSVYNNCFLLSQIDTKNRLSLLYQELYSTFTNIPFFSPKQNAVLKTMR